MSDAPLHPDDRQVIAAPPANTTVLAYDFEIRTETAMRVRRERAGQTDTLTFGVDFVFPLGLGDENGGSLQLVTASQAGDVYYLQSVSPIQRLSDFLAGLGFSATKINADLDYLTIIAQELRRDADAAINGVITNANALLAEIATRLAADQAETQARIAADNAETVARIAADAAEAAARAGGDNILRAAMATLASDIVTQGNVPIYATIDGITGDDGGPGRIIPEKQTLIMVGGQSAVGDGGGGYFSTTETGRPGFVDPAGHVYWRTFGLQIEPEIFDRAYKRWLMGLPAWSPDLEDYQVYSNGGVPAMILPPDHEPIPYGITGVAPNPPVAATVAMLRAVAAHLPKSTNGLEPGELYLNGGVFAVVQGDAE